MQLEQCLYPQKQGFMAKVALVQRWGMEIQQRKSGLGRLLDPKRTNGFGQVSSRAFRLWR
jgi:hypothetical protein